MKAALSSQLTVIALGLLACIAFTMSPQAQGTAPGAPTRTPTRGTPPPALLQPLTTTEIVRRTLPGTVVITGVTSDGSEILGTGFIVESSGTVVTNLHVVEGLERLIVRLSNGDAFDRVLIRAYDEAKDIVILQVPGFSLPTLTLGNSDTVQQGNSIVLIGNPAGLQGTVSAGLVSAIRQLEGYRVFQTDAAASPGSSGGPMLDDSGNVVGILTFRRRGGENLNFVVPINYARGLLQVREDLTLAQLNSRLTPKPAPVPPSPDRTSDPEAAALPSDRVTATARATRIAARQFRFVRLTERFAVADARPLIDQLQRLAAGAGNSAQDWIVDHDHTGSTCRGILTVGPGQLIFRSQNASESFYVPIGDVEVSSLPAFGTFEVSLYSVPSRLPR